MLHRFFSAPSIRILCLVSVCTTSAWTVGCDSGPTDAELAAQKKAEEEAAKKEARRKAKEEADEAARLAEKARAEAAAKPPELKLPKTPASVEALETAASEIYTEHRKTFFCGCAYTSEHRVARGTCGYRTRADEALSKRVSWDRIVPVRAFGAHRACWKTATCKDEAGNAYSGVRCCRETDPVFAAMERDLHNLVPVVSEIQNDRSNFPFGEIEREERLYGACDFEVDRGRKIAEPREEIRGDIARAYLYLYRTYGDGLPLRREELQTFVEWDVADPADEWEVRRNRQIADIQGMSNGFVPLRAGEAGEPLEEATPGEPTEEAPPTETATPAPAVPKSDGGGRGTGPAPAPGAAKPDAPQPPAKKKKAAAPPKGDKAPAQLKDTADAKAPAKEPSKAPDPGGDAAADTKAPAKKTPAPAGSEANADGGAAKAG